MRRIRVSTQRALLFLVLLCLHEFHLDRRSDNRDMENERGDHRSH